MSLQPTTRDAVIARLLEATQLQGQKLADQPEDAHLHHLVATMLGMLGLVEDAEALERSAALLGPEEPRFQRTLARYAERSGDWEKAAGFDAEADRLEEVRFDGFWAEQERQSAQLVNRIRNLVTRCEQLPQFISLGQVDRTERMLRDQVLDYVGHWIYYIEQQYEAGEIAEIPGIGRFHVVDPQQVLHKRLARGMAWELPVAALVAELGARCDPGALMVEVGANVGAHTVVAGIEHRGTVLAFEPVEGNYAELLGNLQRNQVSNVVALQKAASAISGSGHMTRVLKSNPGMAQLVVDPDGDGDGLEITTLDDEVAELGRPVAFIKIDVEGHENQVLDGGWATIERDRPVILCELNPGKNDDGGPVARLKAAGYRSEHVLRADYLFIPEELIDPAEAQQAQAALDEQEPLDPLE